ncbi:MAG TPA: hypothetical protein VI139_09905, partial [Gemmatimonadales bacterium]
AAPGPGTHPQAANPPGSHGPVALQGGVAPLDVTAKRRLANRERGERERQRPNAKYQLEIESDEQGPPTAAQLFRARDQRRAIERDVVGAARQKAAGVLPSQWQALGPTNVGGRVRSMAIDPRNPSRLLAGSASGGLWISEDAGLTWRANMDFFPNLSVSALVFDPVDTNVVYLGTGEASAGLVGVGAFKSTDSGNTWSFLAATNVDTNPDWRFVNRLAVHPAQPQVLLAGVTNNDFQGGGIYRSTDGGATWSKVSNVRALDLAFDPNNPANAVAGPDDGTILYSRDGGLTWQHTAALAPGATTRTRAEIAFSRSQAGLVYASFDNHKGEVWRSSDAGATWQLAATPGHLNVQGDYDNAIWVDPTDGNHVVVAGLDIYQSRDGGASFNKVSDWQNSPASPHADHHVLVSPPSFGSGSAFLYDGNDGGVYRADNVYALSAGGVGIGWSNLNAGLAVTQFYSGAGRSAAGGRIIGGTQDNGSLQLTDQWRAFRGGDGGYVAVDPANDFTFYGEYIYLSIHRVLNGAPATYICNGITEALPSESGGNTYCGSGATKKTNFISPFVLDPGNSSRMLAGASSLWVTDNARALNVSWRAIKPPSAAVDNFINAIAVQEGNGNIVWVGHNNGELYRSNDALSPSPTWTRVDAGLPARRVMRILTDPANASHVIVALTGFVSNNLWQTFDAGASWSSITGNLPFAPIFDVKRHPANPNWLYAATSVGLFTSENGGASWSTTNEGPANIRIRELFWIDNSTLGAATYGRGMFKVSVGAGNVGNYQDLWWAGAQENGWGMSIAQHGSTLFSAMFVYDAAGKPMWVVMPGGSWDASGTAYSGALYSPTSAWFGSYDSARFTAGPSVGNATLTFTGANAATLSYTINGTSGTKSITRQLFGPQDATPTASFGDLWWGGPPENGWGVAINQQYRTLFAVWYTYDSAGRTVWYVVPGGAWTATNTYSGPAYRTTSSSWLGTPYNAAAFNAQPVGNVTFTFSDANNALMTYNVDGVSGSKAITRQPFP